MSTWTRAGPAASAARSRRAARGVALKPNDARALVVRDAAPLQDVRRRLRLRVAREVGGDHAGGAALAHGARPQADRPAQSPSTTAPLTSLPAKSAIRPAPTSTSGSTTPPRRRRERVDAQRDAILLASRAPHSRRLRPRSTACRAPCAQPCPESCIRLDPRAPATRRPPPRRRQRRSRSLQPLGDEVDRAVVGRIAASRHGGAMTPNDLHRDRWLDLRRDGADRSLPHAAAAPRRAAADAAAAPARSPSRRHGDDG